MDKSSYKNGEPLDNSDYFVKWQIAKLCSVDIMPHQLYNLLAGSSVYMPQNMQSQYFWYSVRKRI